MKNTKEYIRRVNAALNRKAFTLPAKTKARLEVVMQAEYTKMLEETLFEPTLGDSVAVKEPLDLRKAPKTATEVVAEKIKDVPDVANER